MTASMGLDIPAEHKFLSVLGTAVSSFVELVGDASLAYAVQLAVHEVCANAIDHAYPQEAGAMPDEARIRVQVQANGEAVRARVADNGRFFDPHTLNWPLTTQWETVETADGAAYRLLHVAEPGIDQERGRGIFLIRQLMDEVLYAGQAGQNVWQLTKVLQ